MGCYSLASSLLRCPGQSRISRSPVTSRCPSSAVETIMRSAGSPCMSVRSPARAGHYAIDGNLDQSLVQEIESPGIEVYTQIEAALLEPHSDFPERDG